MCELILRQICKKYYRVNYVTNSRINLPLFSTVVPAIIFVLLSCRPFVAITTLSTGLVGVDITIDQLNTVGLLK